MADQSYGGSGLFGQPSFGDYSGLSGGVPVPMTPEQIQYQLLKQDVPDYQNVMDMYFGTPNTSSFNANVNSRPTGRELSMNSYLDPNFLPPVPRAESIQVEPVRPVEAINQMDVRKDLPPAPNGQMWEFDANSNQYVLVDDPLSNLSQDASQTAPVASVQQVVRPAPAASLAPTSVLGMFPEVEAMQRALYQQKQNEAMQAQAMQFARLSPMQQAQYSLYMGGQQLGGAIGSALGGKDPQLQQISMRNAIMKRLDPSDPAQQIKVAQEIAQYDPEFAMSIADNARSSLVKIAQANKEQKLSIAPRVQEAQQAASVTQAIAQYKLMPQTPEIVQAIQTLEAQLDFLKPKPEATPNEIQLAQAFAGEKGVKGTPEYNAEYVSQLLRLTDQKENIIDVGVADKTRKVVYFDKKSDQQFTMEPDSTGKLIRTPYSGGIDKTTAKVTATASTKQAEGINKGKIDMATSIEENAFSASDRITLAQNLRELAPKAFTGFAADAKLSASKLASAFGIPTKGGSESEIIDQILGQMTIGAAGQLKGALSDKDVLFLKKTIGTRGLSVNTLLFVADEIERMAAQDRHLNKRINEVTRTGGNLNEINFEEEKSKSSSYVKQQMSDYRDILKKVQNNTATLEEAIKARQIRDQLGL
jgi:hypothetical protein